MEQGGQTEEAEAHVRDRATTGVCQVADHVRVWFCLNWKETTQGKGQVGQQVSVGKHRENKNEDKRAGKVEE